MGFNRVLLTVLLLVLVVDAFIFPSQHELVNISVGSFDIQNYIMLFDVIIYPAELVFLIVLVICSFTLAANLLLKRRLILDKIIIVYFVWVLVFFLVLMLSFYKVPRVKNILFDSRMLLYSLMTPLAYFSFKDSSKAEQFIKRMVRMIAILIPAKLFVAVLPGLSSNFVINSITEIGADWPVYSILFLALVIAKQFIRGSKFSPFTYISLIGSAVLVLASHSRSAIIHAIVVVVAALILVRKPKTKTKILLISSVVVLILLATQTTLLPKSSISEYFSTSSWHSRLALWREGVKKGLMIDPIFGAGLGDRLGPSEKLLGFGRIKEISFLHNIFVTSFYKGGLLLLFSSLFLCIEVLKYYKYSCNNYIKLGVYLFLLGFIVEGLLVPIFYKYRLALLFWIMLGILPRIKATNEVAI